MNEVRSTLAKQGIIKEAVNAVTKYAFDVLRAKRVEIRCDTENVRSKKVCERLGFELEGTLRQNDLKCHGGGPRDTHVYACIDVKNLPVLEVTWGK